MQQSDVTVSHNALVNSCLVPFQKTLVSCFEKGVSYTLQQLFSKAENATSNQQETQLFEQYNLLKKTSGQMSQSLISIIKSMPDEITQQISQSNDAVGLSLVEDEELEISLAFTQLESVLDIKFTNYLFALEKRLKVLFSSKNISKDNMPLGVGSICWIYSRILDLSRSNILTKVTIINNLKNTLSIELNRTYQLIDKQFIDAGILPNIKSEVKRTHKKPGTLAEKTNPENVFGDESTQQSNTSSDSNPQQAQSNGGANQQSMAAPNQNVLFGSGVNNSTELVDSIFDLMNQGRSQGQQRTEASNIDNTIMDSTLDNLSQVTSIAAGATEIDKLKEMILDDVRNETGIYYPSLSMQQQNSLDVMGMFYDQVKSDNSIDGNVISSLNAINIPLIRTAIKDQEFFDRNDHPAREYLEKIIHASQKWHGTSIVKNLHKFSSNIASEYDGTTKSFDQANEDLESYLRLTDRRAKKAEEKWVSAAKGKEKLDISRSKVEEVVENISQTAIPDFVKNVIKYVIQDAMTLSLLRHGEDSAEWHKNINTSETIAKMANPETIKNLTPKQKIESLHHLDQTMDELGFSENDRHKTINNIKECANAATTDDLDEDIKLSDVATINKNKENVKKAGSAKIEELRPLTDQEKSELTKIRLMPYGSLFDFITNQQRDKIRRKLSWFSPVSNKVLFVSLLGKRPYEKSMNAVAIDIVRKNILIVQLEEKRYFKTVLSDIFSKLKGLTKSKPTDDTL